MLQQIRDRATGPLAWFIVALITVPFALWGVNSYFTGGARAEIATVGGRTITQVEFQNAYRQQMGRLRTVLGDRFDPAAIDQAAFRRDVLQGLVAQASLAQHSYAAGYRVSDQQVLAYLTQIPAFQRNGSFSAEAYRSVLQRQGMAPEGFEGSVRQSLMVQQLGEGVTRSAFVTPELVQRVYALSEQQRSFSYVVFSPADYADRVALDDDAIRAYYESHQAQYRTPERVLLAYVALSIDDLAKQVEMDEAALRSLYDSIKETQFTTAGERHVRHILIEAEEGQGGAARQEIERVQAQLQEGADFAELAEQFSDDTGSADEGGDLGWIQSGVMVEPFDQAAFSLEADQVSEPVRTRFGWHLIQVLEVRPTQVKPFDSPEVQDALRARYRREQAQQRFDELSEQLDRLAFENPSSLEPAAEAVGVEVQTSGWVTGESEEGIARYPQVRQAGFSDSVLNQRVNSRLLELGSGRVMVVRLNEHQPRQQRPLDEVRDQVAQAARADRAADAAREAAANAIEAVREGGALEPVAAEHGLPVNSPGSVGRGNAGVPGALLRGVFAMQRPREDGATVETVALPEGGVAVVRLTKVAPGNVDESNPQALDRLRQQLASQAARGEMAAYQRWLSTQMDVEVLQPPIDDRSR